MHKCTEKEDISFSQKKEVNSHMLLPLLLHKYVYTYTPYNAQKKMGRKQQNIYSSRILCSVLSKLHVIDDEYMQKKGEPRGNEV